MNKEHIFYFKSRGEAQSFLGKAKSLVKKQGYASLNDLLVLTDNNRSFTGDPSENYSNLYWYGRDISLARELYTGSKYGSGREYIVRLKNAKTSYENLDPLIIKKYIDDCVYSYIDEDEDEDVY